MNNQNPNEDITNEIRNIFGNIARSVKNIG